MPFFSTEMSIETLQLLVPLVPFIGAVATIILGRVLGSKAHIPAIASIAIAAAAALVLLAVEVERVREGTTVESAARPDESIVTLWQWAGVESDPVDHNANQVATRPFSIDVAATRSTDCHNVVAGHLCWATRGHLFDWLYA